MPVKWSLPENFHVILLFLGFISDESLSEVCLAIKEAVRDFESFEIDFEGIGIGPDPEDPKINFVWTQLKQNDILEKIK